MDHNSREEVDPRIIYAITCIFFTCVISGGVLLALYVLLPSSGPPLLLAGMVLVGIPWIFWFLGYLYTCVVKPYCATRTAARDGGGQVVKEDSSAVTVAVDEGRTAGGATNGERHVQFGSVTVIGSMNENGRNNNDDNNSNNDDNGNNNNDVIRDHGNEYGHDALRDDEDVERGQRDKSRGAMDSKREESSTSSRESETPLRFSVAVA